MKPRPVILLLLLALFALSANRAWACDGHAAKTQPAATEKSCCAKAKVPFATAEKHNPKSAGSSCPCDHRHGGCHCPGCGLVGSASAVFLLHQVPAPATLPPTVSLQKLAFYFAGHLPEAVYLPVWQPPKLS